MSLPLEPKPPAQIPDDAWRRIALAKRRLAVLGPQEAGQEAARASAYILASELRIASFPLEAAIELVRSLTFTEDTTPRRKIVQQMERAAHFAYNTKDGLPILTGCCRDPRPRSAEHTGGKLRAYFKPYCDPACARTCPMLRAIKQPAVALADTPFAAVDDSSLWVHGAQLGDSGRLVYQTLATLALGEPNTEVRANANYLTVKLRGRYQVRQVRRVVGRLADPEVGLIELRDDGIILVRALDPDELTAIEQRLGVAGKREANVREALTEHARLDDWHALIASQAGDEEALTAWDPPPAANLDEQDKPGPDIWRYKRNWGGLFYPDLTCRRLSLGETER